MIIPKLPYRALRNIGGPRYRADLLKFFRQSRGSVPKTPTLGEKLHPYSTVNTFKRAFAPASKQGVLNRVWSAAAPRLEESIQRNEYTWKRYGRRWIGAMGTLATTAAGVGLLNMPKEHIDRLKNEGKVVADYFEPAVDRISRTPIVENLGRMLSGGIPAERRAAIDAGLERQQRGSMARNQAKKSLTIGRYANPENMFDSERRANTRVTFNGSTTPIDPTKPYATADEMLMWEQ